MAKSIASKPTKEVYIINPQVVKLLLRAIQGHASDLASYYESHPSASVDIARLEQANAVLARAWTATKDNVLRSSITRR